MISGLYPLTKAVEKAVAILDDARIRIQANMARRYRTSEGERWIDASGRSSKAFKVDTDNRVTRLVYEGGDVAPFNSIENGTNVMPEPKDLQRWHAEKFGEEICYRYAANIALKIGREGTERFRNPQSWVVTPVIEEAADTLSRELVDEMTEDIYNFLKQ